jgi:hypothetical protein
VLPFSGVFNIVNGTAPVVTALCEHPNISAVSFVGSTKVAEIVSKTGRAKNKRGLCCLCLLDLDLAYSSVCSILQSLPLVVPRITWSLCLIVTWKCAAMILLPLSLAVLVSVAWFDSFACLFFFFCVLILLSLQAASVLLTVGKQEELIKTIVTKAR